MKTDELKKLVEAATPGPWELQGRVLWEKLADDVRGNAVCGLEDFNDEDSLLIAAAPDLAREVISLREAAGELADAVHNFVYGAWENEVHQEEVVIAKLATLRAVLGESE
jgi:hypothetical protein